MNASPLWPAPYRDAPVDVTLAIPGSKSLTNRALVLAALADEPSVLSHPLDSRDTRLMADALAALGAGVETGDDAWTVHPAPLDLSDDVVVDCGLAGTVMRFVPPVAALTRSAVTFDGDPHARVRPMGTTIQGLRGLGVEVDDDARGSLPFVVRGTGHVKGGRVEIDASASSQFVSALLLAGARFDDGIELVHVGASVPSMPHIDMTVAQLRLRGVDVDDSVPHRWAVAPGTVRALDQAIEPDLSNAGAFVAAALVTGGTARVRHWPSVTDQPGDRWRELAALFGGGAEVRDGDLVVEGPDVLDGVRLDLHDEGELTPVVAAVCALASGPSEITGIGHLRGHETDRLAALAREIGALGGDVVETDDGLRIMPAALHGGTFRTYADHRMAHAACVLGLRVEGLQVEDVATTAKTWAAFPDVWERAVRA